MDGELTDIYPVCPDWLTGSVIDVSCTAAGMCCESCESCNALVSVDWPLVFCVDVVHVSCWAYAIGDTDAYETVSGDGEIRPANMSPLRSRCRVDGHSPELARWLCPALVSVFEDCRYSNGSVSADG